MDQLSRGRVVNAPIDGRSAQHDRRGRRPANGSDDHSLERLYARSLRLLCVVGFDGYVKQSNPVWDAVLGYTRDEIMSMPIRELVHPDDLARMADVHKQLMDNQCTLGVEIRVRLKDGSYHWIIWNAAPCVEEDVFFVTAHDITSRKQIEQELQESQTRLGLLASATNECVWDWDARTGRVWRNQEFLQTFGGTETVEGNPLAWWCERIHPDDQARVGAYRPDVEDGREHWKLEYRLRRLDGMYAHVYDRGFVLVGPDGKPARMVGSLMDISALRDAEARLRESQARFELVASATNEFVWDWDLRTGYVWRNEAYIKTFGGVENVSEEIIAWWKERIHPADLPRILASIPAPIVDGQQRWTLDYRLRRLDDTYAHVYDRGFTIFGPEGQPVRMVGSLVDVSALKAAEHKLQQSEERFRLATKATREAIWDWDVQTGQVWRSEGFQIPFGYAASQIDTTIGWWIDRIHPDDRDRVLAEFDLADLSSAPKRSCQYRFRRADGAYADVLDRGFVMFDLDGRPVRMVGSLLDISERRRAEEVAHMQRAELAHDARVRTLGEIATGVAHELNQPLTAIANYAESCAHAISGQDLDHRDKLLTWLEQITNSTQRAAEMIRRLRRFARKSGPRRSAVDVNELVQEVIDLLEAEARLQNIRIRWQSVAATQARIDRVQVQQVLVNLLRNAFEAMCDNPSDRRQVTIKAKAGAEGIELSVEDLGKGVAAEDVDRVFEAFFTTKPNGLGIGLAISRSIIEDHRGRLWVDSGRRGGAVFHFTLPLEGATDGAVAEGSGRR